LCAPAAYAVGTANNQWFQTSNLLIAVLGATAVVIGACSSGYVRERLLGNLALGSAIMTAILLSVGINNPYRSAASLRDQTHPTEIGADAAVLKLAPKSADYLRAMREAATREGFAAGTPVLDLTGRHPTTVYALGGVAPGLPWLIGGFPGSVPFVRAGLRRVSCAHLARAWLLAAADEPRRPEMSALMALKIGPTIPLPRDTLQPLGIERDSFRPVIEIASPIGYGQQLLLAPTDQDETRKRCEAARSVGPEAAASAPGSSHPGVQ
jgi:hypothetical protein